MAKRQLAEVIEEVKKPTVEPITCVARSFECFDNQGFRNFRVVTLYIEDGVIVKVEKSDPWAQFEAIAKQEVMIEMAMLNLNNNWAPGKCLSK